MPRGRYAPSPSGEIHLGNARTALCAWLAARKSRSSFVWRIEDLDGPRSVAGLAERQMRDLLWLGLDWDEGPDCGGPHAPYRQSDRSSHYLEALRRLDSQGLLFPCERSRRELRDIASAPHGPEASPYPTSLRPRHVEPGWLEQLLQTEAPDGVASVRVRVDPGEISFVDLVQGTVTEDVQRAVGDFVLRRRDGLWAYQLAVVVDDAAMEIGEVVRGADLLSSTARQIYLQRCLGLETPHYAHVPLLLAAAGDKLSKRDEALTLSHLRAAGTSAEQIVGFLSYTLGLAPSPEPRPASSLVDTFSWDALSRADHVVPDDLQERFAAGTEALAP